MLLQPLLAGYLEELNRVLYSSQMGVVVDILVGLFLVP